jgi:hypothetical protein
MSAVTQVQVDKLVRKLRANVRIRQFRMLSRPRLYNEGIGVVGKSESNEPIFLASTSKVLILAELAKALEASGIVYFPLDEATFKARVAQNISLYSSGQISLQELFYLVAAQSNNAATRLVKSLRGEQIGNSVLQKNYRTMVPSYTMLETMEGNAHWVQEMPNTGLIHQLGEHMYGLVSRVLHGEANVYERILVNSLENNATDFKFCFTHSELGQKLISKGWQVYEKTGYYPAVSWIGGLAAKGWPVVMTMATLVTVASPLTVETTSVWAYQNVEMPLPWESIVEEGVTFPNEWGPLSVC